MNIMMNQDGLATVQLESATIDLSMSGEMIGLDGMYGEVGMETPNAKGSVMSNWVFVIGITVATLAISVVLGVLLAKKRIKKGFDQYEDQRFD